MVDSRVEDDALARIVAGADGRAEQRIAANRDRKQQILRNGVAKRSAIERAGRNKVTQMITAAQHHIDTEGATKQYLRTRAVGDYKSGVSNRDQLTRAHVQSQSPNRGALSQHAADATAENKPRTRAEERLAPPESTAETRRKLGWSADSHNEPTAPSAASHTRPAAGVTILSMVEYRRPPPGSPRGQPDLNKRRTSSRKPSRSREPPARASNQLTGLKPPGSKYTRRNANIPQTKQQLKEMRGQGGVP